MKKSSKGKVRAGICFFWILLIAQFYVAKNFHEPYPAIAFPSFAHVWNHTDTITFQDDDIFLYTQTGDSLKFEKTKLFSDLPHPVFIPYVRKNIEKRMKKGAHPNADFRVGSFHFSIIFNSQTDSSNTQGLRNWFKSAIARYIPDKKIREITFFTYKYSYNLEHTKLTGERTLVNKFTLSLAD